jgi:hypothetical protein
MTTGNNQIINVQFTGMDQLTPMLDRISVKLLGMQNQFKTFQKAFSGTTLNMKQNADGVWEYEHAFKRATEAAEKFKKTIKGMMGSDLIKKYNLDVMQDLGLDQIMPGLKKAEKAVESIGDKISKFSKKMMMAALGVMFFGMLILRTFKQIATTTLKTFKDMADASSLQVQGLSRLEAAWTFLKWTIGNALATALLPLIPTIVSIISSIADWINQNPKLTASLIGVALMMGAVFFIAGSLWLGISSVAIVVGYLADAFIYLKSIMTIANLTSLATGFWGIFLAVLGVVLILGGIATAFTGMINPANSAGEKIGMVLAGLAISVLGVAIMFGVWPLAMIAALVAMVALMYLFKDQIGDIMLGLYLKFNIMMLDWVLSFMDGLSRMEVLAREWANTMIDVINSVTAGFLNLQHISVEPVISSALTEGVKLTKAMAEVQLDHFTYRSSFGDRAKELFDINSILADLQVPSAADNLAMIDSYTPTTIGASETNSGTNVQGDIVFNLDLSNIGDLTDIPKKLDQLEADLQRYVL